MRPRECTRNPQQTHPSYFPSPSASAQSLPRVRNAPYPNDTVPRAQMQPPWKCIHRCSNVKNNRNPMGAKICGKAQIVLDWGGVSIHREMGESPPQKQATTPICLKSSAVKPLPEIASPKIGQTYLRQQYSRPNILRLFVPKAERLGVGH